MITMFRCVGAKLQGRTPEWIAGMQELLQRMDGELRESGERVDGRPLVDPSQARTVHPHNGVPVPTDRPFAEVKESLARYWIVDPSEEQAIEIASRVVAYTGADGGPVFAFFRNSVRQRRPSQPRGWSRPSGTGRLPARREP